MTILLTFENHDALQPICITQMSRPPCYPFDYGWLVPLNDGQVLTMMRIKPPHVVGLTVYADSRISKDEAYLAIRKHCPEFISYRV